MHGLPMRVRRSWVKIQSHGRFCSVVKICTVLNNYTIFEETNRIATLNQSTKFERNRFFEVCRDFSNLFDKC